MYFNALSYRVSPNEFPVKTAQYGVIVDQTGEILSNCPGAGIDPLSSDCVFSVGSLYSATQNCIAFSCEAFTFDPANGVQTFLSYPLTQGQPGDVVYVRQT